MHRDRRSPRRSAAALRLLLVAAVALIGRPHHDATAAPSDPSQAVIIELTTPSAARAVGANAAAAAQRARVRHDLLALESTNRAARGLGTPRAADVVRYEYRVVANGFAATLLPETIQALTTHPDVKRVVPDGRMEAILDVSVPHVRAPEVWSDFGYRGAGMRIAIIDTGVDYLHADLGGCFGSGCKVIGGWDFINDDSDPMDDQGHGTHVAATAAGDGLLRGVAPDASILAYKVLNSQGFGATSTVIAGIERATDPDDDGDPSDHVDVISMSLGGAGNEDDPGSMAVDAATTAGVLSVIAAGNAHLYFTIGSPGTARTALTVGATDDDDAIAGFSSRGPTVFAALQKPEITAPGVDICAARLPGAWTGRECIDDEHASLSGTSMATPHVAGAAALVRGLMPGLSPAEVKAVLQHGAVPVGLDATSSGAGRLDVRAAVDVRTVLVPSPVNLGLDDASEPSWTGTAAVTVRNLGVTPRTYTVAFDGSTLPAGATGSVAPTQVTVPANGATDVTVSLTADNAVVPPSATPPYLYTGRLVATAPDETRSTTVSFALQPPLANDLCENATELGAGTFAASALTARATASPDDPQSQCGCTHDGGSVWYRVTPTQNGTVRADASLSNYAVVLSAFTGRCGGLRAVACDENATDGTAAIAFQVQAGSSYYIEVASACNFAPGQLTLEIDVPGVQAPPAFEPFTEIFGLRTGDLPGTSLTFTPDGTSYSVCSGFAESYPTDPAGGTALAVTSDAYTAVSLADGATVALFGQRYDELFVGGNGYVTFTAGATGSGPAFRSHFELPAIAPFSTNMLLSPNNLGEVRWQQLADRAALTWDGVQSVEPNVNVYPFNRVQLEMFFDGRIRMTFVDTGFHGLTGLSRGTGAPGLFAESNFLAVPHCRAPAGGEIQLGGKRLTFRTVALAPETSKLKLVFGSTDVASIPAAASGGDPTVGGAALEIYNRRNVQFTSIPLPAAAWRRITASNGTTAYQYRDNDGVYGPCSAVDVAARGIRAKCRGALGYTLTNGIQTKLAASLTLGSKTAGRRFCTLFEYPAVRKDVAGTFVAGKIAAPVRCWLPESYYY